MTKKLNCIMLIDDDEPTNFMSNMELEEANCTSHILIADSGEKALNYLAETNTADNGVPFPELIFLDINMPAMNGWEFLDKYSDLKNKLVHSPVIIMLTTSCNPGDKLKAASIPLIAGFENKPLTAELIEKVLTKHFNNG